MTYKIHLENFEGPLDLLLYFIRRDELDIYDIPIAKITKDFIDIVEEWKRLNLLIAGDFIVMASTLMRIKAKMMIPRPEIDDDGEIIDPRSELIQQLIDYRRYRNAAETLKNMAEKRKEYIPRQFQQNIVDSDNGFNFTLNDVSLYELAKVFKNVLEKRPVVSQFELNREPIRLEEQKEMILKYFDAEGRLNFTILLANLKTRLEVIVTFLAVLDLIHEGSCIIKQSNIFGEIELAYHKIIA